MHTKRSKIVPIRIPWTMLEVINEAIRDANASKRGRTNLNLSKWLRQAIREKLDHRERSRKSSARRQADRQEVGL